MKTRARIDAALTADLAVLAAVVRLVVIVVAQCEPVWDGHYYDVGARRIAEGHGYSEDLHLPGPDGHEQIIWHPWAHYPVGYPGFLALFHLALRTVGAPGALAGPIANLLTGAALVAIVHRLAMRAFPESTARPTIAALLVALHPGLVLYAGALMTEPLAAALMLGAILAAVSMRRMGAALLVAGAALGLATLVRPNAILMAPIVGLAATFREDASLVARSAFARLARGAASAIVVSMLALATVAPWTARNCRVMDACTLVSTNAGWNLVIGAAPGATGKFEFLVGHTPSGAPECDEGGQVGQDRCWWRYGASVIRRDFRRWIALVPAKLHYTFDVEWFPINYLREARPDVVSASTHVLFGRVLTGTNQALLTLAALAALALRQRDRRTPHPVQALALVAVAAVAIAGLDVGSPRAWPLAAIAALLPFVPLPGAPSRNAALLSVVALVTTTALTHAIFFGEDRYHLVASPAVALLAAGFGRSSARRRTVA
jgi:hypothetical protein